MRSDPVRFSAGLLLVLGGGALLSSGCAQPAEVSPADVPALAQRAAKEPNNPELLTRFSAALFAAQQCDSAEAVATRALTLKADEPVAVLVAGQCDERNNRFAAALSRYRGFVTGYPGSSGVAAVRARTLLAERAQAVAQARQALQQEQQLSQQPADPQTVAVLPLTIQGDSSYQPLSRGLAQILISDLSLLQRFKMVERLQLSALLDEMHLGESGRVDQATAARVGHLMQAGRLVEGLAAIPSERNVRLETTVVRGNGEVTTPQVQTGRLDDLLKMEKQIVLGLAGQLGYTLSEAERRAIMENGTQNLAAFLAYSNGLIEEDRGDFSRAAAYYGQAVRSDPGFQQAKTQFQASAAAPAMQTSQQSGQVAAAVQQANNAVSPSGGTGEPSSSAVNGGVTDLASTRSEQTAGSSQQVTQSAAASTASNPPPLPVTPPPTITGTIRIVFRLP